MPHQKYTFYLWKNTPISALGSVTIYGPQAHDIRPKKCFD